MAAAAKTRPSLEPAPSWRRRGAVRVALRAVQRDEDHPQDHYALQTAIYINALIMVLCSLKDMKKHEIAEQEAFFFFFVLGRSDGWLPERKFTVHMVIFCCCSCLAEVPFKYFIKTWISDQMYFCLWIIEEKPNFPGAERKQKHRYEAHRCCLRNLNLYALFMSWSRMGRKGKLS